MKIWFKIDQAESFHRGIDAPDPIVSLEINPALLSEHQRDLIHKHLLGTNVVYDPKRAMQEYETVPIGGHPPDELVEAKDPRLESLLMALTELEQSNNSAVHAIYFHAKPIERAERQQSVNK